MVFRQLPLHFSLLALLRPLTGVELLFTPQQFQTLDFQFLVTPEDPCLDFIPLTSKIALAFVQPRDPLPGLVAALSHFDRRIVILVGQPTPQFRQRFDQQWRFHAASKLRPKLLASQPHFQRLLMAVCHFRFELLKRFAFAVE